MTQSYAGGLDQLNSLDRILVCKLSCLLFIFRLQMKLSIVADSVLGLSNFFSFVFSPANEAQSCC